MQSAFWKVIFSLIVTLNYSLSYGQIGDIVLPEDFYNEIVTSNFTNPVGMTFDENNTMYVWEKGGVIHIVDTNGLRLPQPLIDLSEEVGDYFDHGLLGFTLDPAFLSNGYIYLLYVVDRHHLIYHGTSQFSIDSLDQVGATIGRLTRYTADASNNFQTVDLSSRKILLGQTKTNGIPIVGRFHGMGTVAFGKDGSLIITNGDGNAGGPDVGIVADTFSEQTQVALLDGILRPEEHLGLYRSQYLGSYNGKVLRLHPETGEGLPSNPFFDPQNPNSATSKTYSYGLRNPFRVNFFPNTGSHVMSDGEPGVLLIGDVGANLFEEMNISYGGENFGWPIFAGNWSANNFLSYGVPANPLAPNSLFGTNGCDEEFLKFDALLAYPDLFPVHQNPCDNSIGIPQTIHTNVATPPFYAYKNKYLNWGEASFIHRFDDDGNYQVVEVGDTASWIEGDDISGKCSIGGIFYDQELFPEKYHGAYFHGDYGGWIKAFYFDDNQELYKTEDFLEGSDQILGLQVNPTDGCLYYINGIDGINRVCYGGNPAPKAVIEVDQYYGISPLTVQFDGSSSFDIFDDPLTYHWDFGNGQTSTDSMPTMTFVADTDEPTPFTITLTVTDTSGLTGVSEVIISLNNTPPVINIASFENGDLYPAFKTTNLPLYADVSDSESSNENLTYSWRVFLHHKDHFHPEAPDTRVETYTPIAPLGCIDEYYYVRVGLYVTDEHGLTSYTEKNTYPDCSNRRLAEVINLSAIGQDNQVLLSWATTSEDSIVRFEMERSSDIWHFKKIGEVAATGGVNMNAEYQFLDAEPLSGAMFYRLKLYRANGAFDYTDRVAFKFTFDIIDLYPNPNNGIVNIYPTDDFENVTLSFFNTQGQLIESHRLTDVRESQIEQVRTQHIQNGVYIYKIKADGQVMSGKMIFNK